MRKVVSSMAKRNVRSEVSPLSPSKLGPPLLLLPSSSPFLSSSPLTIVRAKERESFHERESHLVASIARISTPPNSRRIPLRGILKKKLTSHARHTRYNSKPKHKD